MRTRTKGIQLANDGSRSVDKQYQGTRIFERLGKVTQDEAESWLRQRQAELDAERANLLRCGDQQLFAAAAQKYLIESERKKLRSLETVAYHVALLLPYVGSMALVDVCNDSLQPFIDERLDEDEVKPSTVNRTLEVARTIMNRAARLWRTNGKPWLATAPLIEMLDEKATRRQPYPITWQQQANVLPRLPVHLQRMVLFALNTGARDANVCRLRWEWERQLPELGRSVFVIPPAEFKTNRTHVLILNDAAWSVVQECRGMHPEFVFTYRRERVKNLHLAPAMDYKPIATMNNTAFQNARSAAGLERMRVHDLRHTFGQRLRDAGVPEEDRALLLGHAIDGMPQHYATATVARLVEMANKVKETFERTTLLRVVNG
ncbi:tyrosine-type recombinase/integrase [Acidovorax sp.]|uniref:tyrosine-type recombinase/integrase n=1 Tax=Acidovorax sp. TaxID=1872122 RepID=UPI00391B8B70